MDFLTKYSQAILGILRIVVGAQFLQHGLSKIAGFPMAPPVIVQNGSINLNLEMGVDEKIFGFGEQFSRFEKSGQELVLKVNDALGTGTGLTYKPVPLWHSTAGYSAFVNTGATLTGTTLAMGAGGTLAIASDSLVTFGETRLPHGYEANAKMFSIAGSFIGAVGSTAHMPVLRQALGALSKDELQLHSRDALFETFVRLHPSSRTASSSIPRNTTAIPTKAASSRS